MGIGAVACSFEGRGDEPNADGVLIRTRKSVSEISTTHQKPGFCEKSGFLNFHEHLFIAPL